ncbi:MAG: hypothetical protein QME66_09335 [Candidatus Eisenbacteria bacterium]|nr:hypothetical protein [Candidatus Eisenbacteria bacterium]
MPSSSAEIIENILSYLDFPQDRRTYFINNLTYMPKEILSAILRALEKRGLG